MASPRPTASTPSLVLPFTLTAADVDAERVGEPVANAIDERRNLRPLEDDHDVDVLDLEARARAPWRRTCAAASMLDAPFHARIGVGKVPPDVAERRRRRGSRRSRRGRRRRRRSDRARRARPASSRRRASAAVLPPAGAGRSQCRAPRRRPATRARARSRSAAVVIFTFAASPSTTCTRMAGPLGKHRFVGRLDAGAAERNRRSEDLAAECLRRLRQEDLSRAAASRQSRRRP